MSESATSWTPTIRSYLEVLKSEITKGGMTNPELSIKGAPIKSAIGLDIESNIWLSIECDPKTVSVDDLSALVSFKKRSTGYQILVGSDAEESAVRFFEEVAELLGAGTPQVMREERRCKTGVNCSPVRPEPPSPKTLSSVCLANLKSWSSS